VAYSVNWITKVITIPTSDLTLVSGTRYKLLMSDFLAECRRLEWDFAEGLWAPPILDHSNTRVDFAGVDYAPFDEVVNGYTVQVTGAATRVDLIGSNNNIIDVLIATGVSVVPNNSAGLQIVSTGSGLSAGQDAKLTNVDSAVNANLKNIEGTDSHAMVMRVIRAALCGTAKDADTNGPITEDTVRIAYMSSDGSKPRLIFDVVNLYGTRTGATLDMSP